MDCRHLPVHESNQQNGDGPTTIAFFMVLEIGVFHHADLLWVPDRRRAQPMDRRQRF